jgi:hypothetical protein
VESLGNFLTWADTWAKLARVLIVVSVIDSFLHLGSQGLKALLEPSQCTRDSGCSMHLRRLLEAENPNELRYNLKFISLREDVVKEKDVKVMNRFVGFNEKNEGGDFERNLRRVGIWAGVKF